MASLAKLRKTAKAAGIPASEIRGAESAEELQTIIDNYDGGSTKTKARKAVKKAVAKKAAKKVSEVSPPRKRGRPKGSKNKSPVSKRAPAEKSTRGKAKRPAAAKAAKTYYVPKGGRNLIEDVDLHAEGDWNPREDSAPDRIMKALRKAKGDRDKAFEILWPDRWDFVGRKKRNGEKRTTDEARDYLKYRIARTLWDFVLKTRQHKIATNRINAAENGAPAAPKKRGRPKGSGTKPKTEKATTGAKRGRPKGSGVKPGAKRGRGRPKGSKNKPK